MRVTVALLITACLLALSTAAAATLPPPPTRLGGAWADDPRCAGPAPIWMRLVGC